MMLESQHELDESSRRRRQRRRSSPGASSSSDDGADAAGTATATTSATVSRRRSSPRRSGNRRDDDRRRYSGSSSSKNRRRSKTRSRSPRRERRPNVVPPPPAPFVPPSPLDALEKERQQIDRDQRTVFASQIHPKVTMRQIFVFFSQVGKVRDVQCIEDQRTRKFKGIAYVEMDAHDTVQLALALNGHLLGGYPVNVQLTQAEKNRAAQQANLAQAALLEQPMRVRVQNLHVAVGEDDLKEFFIGFGQVDACQIDRNSSGESLGTAWITFRRVPDAQAAVSSLDQITVLGQQITVTLEVPLIGLTLPGLAGSQVMTMQLQQQQLANDSMQHSMMQSNSGQLGELDDDSGGGLHLSSQHRLALMQRLQRSGRDEIIMPQPQAAPAPVPPRLPAIVQPTTCIVLKNMFTQAEIQAEPDLPLDIKEDVQLEASKHGRLLHIHVDQTSDGHVFLRYTNQDSAGASLNMFNGRWFASRQVVAEFVVERAYELRFPGSGRGM